MVKYFRLHLLFIFRCRQVKTSNKVMNEFHHSHSIPMVIAKPAGAPWIIVSAAGDRDGEDTRSRRGDATQAY